MPYPRLVSRYFDAPVNVGPLAAASGHICRGEAGDMGRGTWVVFECLTESGRIERLVFRAYGCPYVIAACSRVTELLAGAGAAALAEFSPSALAAELDVPTEKLGSLLIIQDALRNCFRDWDTTRPAAAR